MLVHEITIDATLLNEDYSLMLLSYFFFSGPSIITNIDRQQSRPHTAYVCLLIAESLQSVSFVRVNKTMST